MRLPPVSHHAMGAQCVPFSLQNLPREQSVHVADGLCMEPVAPAPHSQKAFGTEIVYSGWWLALDVRSAAYKLITQFSYILGPRIIYIKQLAKNS